MRLTISKRFELSSSARQYRADWSEQQNESAFGPFSRGQYGHGYNYVAYFIFSGPVDLNNGMMLNVSTIKELIKAMLAERYDHKFLNRDNPLFADTPPTAEALALSLLRDASPLFANESARLVACHLCETSVAEATAYTDGHVERHFWTSFSAARRTCSPHLSDEENEKLFGVASKKEGHGHNYRLRVTLEGQPDAQTGLVVPYEQSHSAHEAIRTELDHKNLNDEVDWLSDQPMTTESLSRLIKQRLNQTLPVNRVRLYELPEFFAECVAHNSIRLGYRDSFHAAHRLHSEQLSEQTNQETYGKCNNPQGHGHEYVVEATIKNKYDERTGTIFDFLKLVNGLRQAYADWNFRHLDIEVPEFAGTVTTGENIVGLLWPRMDRELDGKLNRLRLWETFNNRFTLRREEPK